MLAVFCLGLVMVPDTSKAQATLNLNYNVSMPAGDFKNFISNNSYKGFTADLLFDLNSHLALGLGTGWQDYYQKYPRQVYKLSDGSDVSAVVSNSVQTTPLLFTARYNFLPGKGIQPYVSVGAGGNFVSYRQYLGEFGGSQTNFTFAARPEAGLFIPFSKRSAAGITFNAGYNYMPYNYNGLKDLNSWGVGAGIKFPLK